MKCIIEHIIFNIILLIACISSMLDNASDVAKETTLYTTAQILQSVSSSLLAHANSATSIVLNLI